MSEGNRPPSLVQNWCRVHDFYREEDSYRLLNCVWYSLNIRSGLGSSGISVGVDRNISEQKRSVCVVCRLSMAAGLLSLLSVTRAFDVCQMLINSTTTRGQSLQTPEKLIKALSQGRLFRYIGAE